MFPQAFDLIPVEVEDYGYVRRFEAVDMRFAAHSLSKMGLAGKIRKNFQICVSPQNHLASTLGMANACTQKQMRRRDIGSVLFHQQM